MYQLQHSFKTLISIMKTNHNTVYEGLIRKAYTYAEKLHKDQKRRTGEPYIMHPLRVACLVASWGSETDMVIAALLHDVVEDCHIAISEITELFGSNVADMVDTLTAVNKDLEIAKGKTKAEIDNMSDARLINMITKKALLIKVADRIDNLNTISDFPIEKQLGKAQHTREILIPMVKKVGAYMLVNELEELCIVIEHKDNYNEISSRYYELINQNSFSCNVMLNLFKNAFKTNSSVYPNELIHYKDCISEFTYNPRSIISIYRQIVRNSSNLDADITKLLTKKHIPLYDLTLVIKDEFAEDISIISPMDIFFKFYEEVFVDKGLCICSFNKTTYEDSDYVVLRDELDNLYRLFIKSEKEYLRYKLGDVLEDLEELKYNDVNVVDPRDAYNKKIKVFKRDGSVMFIDEGATVLDFAFAIHSHLGLNFAYALIDNSLTQLPPYTRLSEGDKVTIFTTDEPVATISWFKYVKTSKAVDYLVKEFSPKKDESSAK